MSALDNAALAEGLDRAVDELLAVRTALSALPVGLPDMALDDALRQDPGFQQAREDFARTLERLLYEVGGELRDELLRVESVANVLVGRGLDIAWRLALRTRQGGA